ncbi:MAG TPA: type VI secretion system baseplate subunit TssE [Myxococcota bacterium]|nr:type VI secretion system baseplate subunit TssE [Myxococcota bacterium]
MVETQGAAERLQPSLLDRLTDDNPESQVESRDGRVIDIGRLRAIVLRDLSYLFNTVNQREILDLAKFPRAAKSGLNYGVNDLAGHSNTAMKAQELQRGLKAAVDVFEPRVIPGTLEIRVGDQANRSEALIVLDIRGEIWAYPLPIELYMRTQLDLSTGAISVSEKT